MLVTIGSDGISNWVRLPDGQQFNLGPVSVLSFATQLSSVSAAKKALQRFLTFGEAMLSVDRGRLWDVLAPRPPRLATEGPFITQDCRDTMGDIHQQLDALRDHLQVLAQSLKKHFEAGKKSSLVVVAEGDTPGGAQAIADKVGWLIGADYRVVALGHVQRGGSPTARDRILASELGAAAVNGLADGVDGCMVGQIGSEIVETPLEETWTKTKELDTRRLRMLHILSI